MSDQQGEDYVEHGPTEKGVFEPSSCSYCGGATFTTQVNNGRAQRATCADCGGTMVSNGGQWMPDLIGQPDNHPSTQADPRSGGVGGIGDAPVVRREEDLNSRTAGVDWCRHRRSEHCWLPRNDSAHGGFALYIPQDRGVCPWTTASMQQINCPMSEPGPMAGMERAGAMDYHINHRPADPDPDSAAPFHALNHNHNIIFPDDVYTHPHYYTAFPKQKETVQQMHKARGNPDHPVNIYRATPAQHSRINTGDWVTTSAEYAKGHAGQFADNDSGEKWHVVKATVPAKHLWSQGDELHEWGYHGAGLGDVQKHASLADPEWIFHITAAWRDVRAKAKRIRAEGGVSIVSVLADGVTGHVNGDTGVYESQINYVPGSFKIGHWQCGCAWASYAWGRSPAFKRFEGRMCSHALALQFEAQSRGMFGKQVTEDTTRPGWMRDKVRVRHDRVTRDHDVREAALRRLDPEGVYPTGHGLDLEGAPIHAFAAVAYAARQDPADAMRVFLAAGIEHTAARRLLDTIAVGDQSLHMDVQRAFDKAHDNEREKHQDDAKYATNYHPLKNSDIPEAHHGGWKFEHNSDAAPHDEFHDLFKDITPGWSGRPTHETDPHQGPVALTHFKHPSTYERLHLDQHGNAWARHMTSKQTEGGSHVPVFQHWSGPHSASEVLANHPTFSQGQRTGEDANTVHWEPHNTRVDRGRFDHTDSYEDISRGYHQTMREHGWGVVGAKDEAPAEPTHAGVALKAADTGRILMIQRSNHDETDPAAGTWELPGGGREKGDHNSLMSAVREFQEEVGQEFPTGGHVSHVWQSPNGVYQGHVVVVPNESAIDFSNGRRTTNPDDPDGDDHEQSAWWDPDHARKNPALRPECKTMPWDKIKTASLGTEAGIFTRKPTGPDTRPPVDPADEKPMRACDGCKDCAVCGDKSVAVDTLWDHGLCPEHLHARQSGEDPIRDAGRLKPVLAGAWRAGTKHTAADPTQEIYSAQHVFSQNRDKYFGGPKEELSRYKHQPHKAEFRLEHVPIAHLRQHTFEGIEPLLKYHELDNGDPDDHERLDRIEKSRRPLAPGIAVHHQDQYLLLDGQHRAAVYERQGRTHMPVYVTDSDPGKNIFKHPGSLAKFRRRVAEYASGDFLEDMGIDPRPKAPPKVPDPEQGENPASTGWATSQDPPEWDGASQSPGAMSMTTWSTLHDEPEPALPSTDGAEETEGERYRAQMRPEIDLATEESAPSDGRTASVTDIVERFQATAGARALQQQGGPQDMDIASAARAHLEDTGMRRTALKEFSSAEQNALITEGGADVRARNFADLDIANTHYADLQTALDSQSALDEAADELFS